MQAVKWTHELNNFELHLDLFPILILSGRILCTPALTLFGHHS
jgi:hypothetical protein